MRRAWANVLVVGLGVVLCSCAGSGNSQETATAKQGSVATPAQQAPSAAPQVAQASPAAPDANQIVAERPPPPPAIARQEPVVEAKAEPIAGMREVFPHVRANLKAKVIEFDAVVTPALVPDPQAPLFYLEVAVCTWNTREHETLLVTDAKPSHVHAAMLLIGLEPGRPGAIRVREGKLVVEEPRGAKLSVEFEYRDADGNVHHAKPEDWAMSAKSKVTLAELGAGEAAAGGAPVVRPAWVFAGSVLLPPLPGTDAPPDAKVYDADGTGTLIGLTTFGSETIAWSRVFSPEEALAEPEWVANMDVVPRGGTPVVVRIRGE